MKPEGYGYKGNWPLLTDDTKLQKYVPNNRNHTNLDIPTAKTKGENNYIINTLAFSYYFK